MGKQFFFLPFFFLWTRRLQVLQGMPVCTFTQIFEKLTCVRRANVKSYLSLKSWSHRTRELPSRYLFFMGFNLNQPEQFWLHPWYRWNNVTVVFRLLFVVYLAQAHRVSFSCCLMLCKVRCSCAPATRHTAFGEYGYMEGDLNLLGTIILRAYVSTVQVLMSY